MPKILGYFDSNALEVLKRLETIEMAAGFLRAFIGDNEEFEFTEIDIDMFRSWLTQDEILEKLRILEEVINILVKNKFGNDIRKL